MLRDDSFENGNVDFYISNDKRSCHTNFFDKKRNLKPNKIFNY